MSDDDDAAQRARLARWSRTVAENVPHNHALGIEVLELGADFAVFRLPYDARLVGNPETGVLHGGVITALLDACSGAAVFAALARPMAIATLDLRIDYLKPAAAGREVRARATCFRTTRNVAFTRALAFHDDEADPIAAAAGTFMLGTKLGTVRSPKGGRVSLLEVIAAAKQAGDLRALIDVIPYARWLGLTGHTEGDELIVRMAYGAHLIGNPSLPALHGGTLGALLESTAIFELLWQAETVVLPKTITITVDYLRSAAAVDTYARGTITRHGRRVANVAVEAWQDDRARPVATAHAHFLVMAET